MHNVNSRARGAAHRLLGAAIALAALTLAQVAAAGPLVSATELAARLSRADAPRVIDIRNGQPDSGKTPYDAGHIAGSLPAPYPLWRGPADNPGQLPATEKLVALVQSLGIDAATPVVVAYEGTDSTDFGAAARVYWTLKAAGVRDLAILNGGIGAWRAAGLPLTAAATKSVARTNFVFTLDAKFVATRADVLRAQDAKDAMLLDARPAPFFKGETKHAAAATPGTIAGAVSLDNAVWFKADSAAIDEPEVLRRLAAEKGVGALPSVSFCNTGHWAATNWFVLSELLGQPNARLYAESVVEWSRTGGAMDNVPGRLQQFAQQLKSALNPQ